MVKKGLRELMAWQKGKDWTVFLYRDVSLGSFAKDYSLTDQIRRAAVSIPSNITGGDERETDNEAVRCFYILKGSSAEILAKAIIAHEIEYINRDVFPQFENACTEISSMLAILTSARSL